MSKNDKAMELYKESIISSFNWQYKKRRGNQDKNHSDVTISIQKAGKDRMAVTIILRNDVEKRIDKDGIGNIAVAQKGKTVYFKADKNGYKVSGGKNTTHKYIKFSLNDAYKALEGDYELKYQDFLELYYVEK